MSPSQPSLSLGPLLPPQHFVPRNPHPSQAENPSSDGEVPALIPPLYFNTSSSGTKSKIPKGHGHLAETAPRFGLVDPNDGMRVRSDRGQWGRDLSKSPMEDYF